MKNCRECSRIYKANFEYLLILKIQIFFLSLNTTIRKIFVLFLITIHQLFMISIMNKGLFFRFSGSKVKRFFVIFEFSSQIFYHFIIMQFIKLKKNSVLQLDSIFIFIIPLSSALFLSLKQSFLYEERETECCSFRELCVDRNKFSFQGVILAEYKGLEKNSLPRWNRLYLNTSKHKG